MSNEDELLPIDLVGEARMLCITVSSAMGTLTRLLTTFTSREFAIYSVSVGSTEKKGLWKVFIGVYADYRSLRQVMGQLFKLHDIIKVEEITDNSSEIKRTQRELALMKISVKENQYAKLLTIIKDLEIKGSIYGISSVKQVIIANEAIIKEPSDKVISEITFEIVGTSQGVESIYEIVQNEFEIIELVRTGIISLVIRNETKSKGHR